MSTLIPSGTTPIVSVAKFRQVSICGRPTRAHRQKRKLRSNPRCARLGVCRRARLRSGLGLGEAAGEWRGPTSRACLTGCTQEGASVTWRRGLTLVRASSGAATGGAARMERYSTEVQQHTRTRADLRGRGRTVTCGYGRGWTCCRQMACKRSAVRARLAPPQLRWTTSNVEPASNCPAGGNLRGKIRPHDGCTSSSRVKFDQVRPGE
jgi:hypothetical protein